MNIDAALAFRERLKGFVGHLGSHFANMDERAEVPIEWLLDELKL